MWRELAKNRNFLALWSGQILSQLAVNSLIFALLIRVYELTHSNTASSFLVISAGIAAVIFGVVAGVLVDLWNRKWVLVYANWIRAGAVLLFFLLSENLAAIYLLMFVLNAVTQFFVPAEAPTIPFLVKKELVFTANSLFIATVYATIILGPTLAGPLLHLLGPENLYLLFSALFVLAGIACWQLPELNQKLKSKTAQNGQAGGNGLAAFYQVKEELLKGFQIVMTNRRVALPIFVLVLSQAVIASLGALAPGFAFGAFALSAKDASLAIMGPAALGMIIGAVGVGRLGVKIKNEKLIYWGIILAGGFLLILAFLRYLPLAMLALFLLGGANALIDVSANTNLQKEAPEEIRGRIYGILTTAAGGAALLPVALVGPLADLAGVRWVIAGLGGTVLILGVLLKKRGLVE